MVSQTAEYALRAILCLAERPEVPCTACQVAQATGLPPGYLAKVLLELSRAGLVHSQRGPHGGYRLARPFSSMTVLDVINAVSPLRRVVLPRDESSGVQSDPHPPLEPINDAIDLVEHYLGRLTLEDLLCNRCRPPPDVRPGQCD